MQQFARRHMVLEGSLGIVVCTIPDFPTVYIRVRSLSDRLNGNMEK